MKTIFTLIFHFSFFTFHSYSQAVGIGTSSPSDALHIVGASNDDPLRVQVGTATKLRVFNNGGTSIGVNNASGTPVNGLYVEGNTGLGVGSPTDKLSVNGNINTTGEIKTNGTSGEEGQLLMSNGNGTMSWADPCEYKKFRDFFVTGDQQWVVPSGVTEIMVEMWGAGGGGSINFGGGGGGYIKFVRAVNPGDTINLTIGTGGEGIQSNGTAATNGTATTFPSTNSQTNSANGGSSGLTGLGGSVSITASALNPSMRLRGQHGKPRDVAYYQISATDFAQKTIYGTGGLSGFSQNPTGYGSIIVQNTTTNALIFSHSGKPGNQPGGGGGGGAGTSAPLSTGASGGDGYVIIYW